MISEHEREELGELQEGFLQCFEMVYPQLDWDAAIDAELGLTLTVAPVHEPFGPIFVYFWEEGVIVRLGAVFHCHISAVMSGAKSVDDVHREALEEAINFIAAVLEDEVVVQTEYVGDTVVRAEGLWAETGESICAILPLAGFAAREKNPDAPVRIERHVWTHSLPMGDGGGSATGEDGA